MVHLHITDKARPLSGSQLLCFFFCSVTYKHKEIFLLRHFSFNIIQQHWAVIAISTSCCSKRSTRIDAKQFLLPKNDTFQRGPFGFQNSVHIALQPVPLRWLALATRFQQQSLLAWDAMFAVVITVFMGASHSALAFIYDSQKGHKRRERGWSLWLLLFAIARPCLAHPLLRAGIPSLITGHPPCCRSNVAIKVVWESGAFVQLECSAINRLRTKVINCVTKEADQRQRTGRKEPLLACHIDFIWKAFLPGVVWPPRVCLVSEGCTQYYALPYHREALLGPMSRPWILSPPNQHR